MTMHGAITDDQASALAEFVHLTRGWDVPGVRVAISQARHIADANKLAVALIRYSERADVNTPGLFAQDGPHWHGDKDGPAPRLPVAKCEIHPHSTLPCRDCAAETKGADGWLEPDQPSPQHVADYHAGMARARAALAQARRHPRTDEPYTDAQMSAAGDTD